MRRVERESGPVAGGADVGAGCVWAVSPLPEECTVSWRVVDGERSTGVRHVELLGEPR